MWSLPTRITISGITGEKENIPSFKKEPKKTWKDLNMVVLLIDWLIDWHIWVLLTRVDDVTGSKRRQQQKRLSW